MNLQVTYRDDTATRIEREATLTEDYVAFQLEGSTAVWCGQDVADLPDVLDAVEALPFVQAATLEVSV